MAIPRDRGAAAVEMAIILPVLILLVFGIIDFSRILSGMLEVSQGAREGVRLASLAPNYTTAQVTQRAKDAAPNPGFGGTAVVALDKTCPNGDDYAQVTVSFNFSGILFHPGAGKTFSQSARMRCGG
ncbi:TadE/TadG family type IV pilus assembly protein [Knoellia sp. p5-6-4]|uniref:TadE/TadG family type IV pilus assembly protein n=1 Tax=unclassified Knoellia TaxID=2618719 RepID=UPI0023D9DC05|nr:TadE family protein [Knoellia sp. p5-6-4]MDF2146413.1 pilus assembly protein [Knoellia sp. p5-6-4]